MKKLNELYDGDRPREKLLQKGAAALRDYELTAVLLGIELLDHVILAREGFLSLREEGMV